MCGYVNVYVGMWVAWVCGCVCGYMDVCEGGIWVCVGIWMNVCGVCGYVWVHGCVCGCVGM